MRKRGGSGDDAGRLDRGDRVSRHAYRWGPERAPPRFADTYLQGRWTTGQRRNCNRTEHEQTVFRNDGTFATEHNGKALAVGFWRVEDDRIEMHILTTEASLSQSCRMRFPATTMPCRSRAWPST